MTIMCEKPKNSDDSSNQLNYPSFHDIGWDEEEGIEDPEFDICSICGGESTGGDHLSCQYEEAGI